MNNEQQKDIEHQKNIERYRTIETLLPTVESKLIELRKEIEELETKILSYRLKFHNGDYCGDPKGDICNAEKGEEVYVIRKEWKGARRGKVFNKDWGCKPYEDGNKWFAFYEIEFSDTMLTLHHDQIIKVSEIENYLDTENYKKEQ